MYNIESTDYGFRVTLSGTVTLDEVIELEAKMHEMIQERRRPYSVVADLREMIPATDSVKDKIRSCEEMSAASGLQRRAVIVRSPVIRGQVCQVSIQSGTDNIERVIDASITADCEQLALEWVVDGIDPNPAMQLALALRG